MNNSFVLDMRLGLATLSCIEMIMILYSLRNRRGRNPRTKGIKSVFDIMGRHSRA